MKRTQRKKIPGQIPGFFKADELVQEITLNGVKRRMIVGENAMLMVMVQEPGVTGTPHKHTIENLVRIDCFSPLLPGMYVPIWYRERRKEKGSQDEP
jgi:hypothetical protein